MDLSASSLQLLRSWFQESLGVNSRLVHSLVALVARPGTLTVDHVQGRRQRHASPLQLYSFLSVAFFFVFLASRGVAARYYGLEQADLSSYAEMMARLVLMLVPIVALALKVVVAWRRPFNEHLVFAFHLTGAVFAGLTVVVAMATAWKTAWRTYTAAPADVLLVVHVPVGVSLFAYGVLALRRVYGGSLAGAVLKATLVAAASVAALLGLLAGAQWI